MNHCNLSFFPRTVRGFARKRTVATSPGSLPAKWGGSVTVGLPDSRYWSCNKATNVPKMRARSGPHPCDKLRKTGNELHSSPVRASLYRPRADAMAGIPAHADAWRAHRRQRSRTIVCAGGRCAPRHRHAWRAGLGAQLQTIPLTPIRRHPRAANWCKECSAPSTALIRSSSWACRRPISAAT